MDHIAIKINGSFLDLSPNLQLRIRMRGPLFKRDFLPRSYTYPFKIPATPKNNKILGYRHLTDAHQRNFQDTVELYLEGQLFGEGLLNIRSYSNGEFDSDILLDLGAFDELIKDKTLKDVDYGDPIHMGATTNDVLAQAKDLSINAAPHRKITFFPIRNIGFYDDKNLFFGVHVNQWVRFYSDGHFVPGMDNINENDTIEIDIYDVENDESHSFTWTAKDDPDLSLNQFSSNSDPNVPTTGFPPIQTAILYLDFIRKQLIENEDFNEWFTFKAEPSIFTFSGFDVDAFKITCKEDSSKVIITRAVLTSLNWGTDPSQTQIFDEVYEQSFLNYYDNNEYQKDISSDLTVRGRYYTLCPFAYMEYILERIFKTENVHFINEFFLKNPEIRTLVLYQNYALDLIAANGLNELKKSFSINQIIPEETVKKFIVDFNKLFGLILYKKRSNNTFYLISLKSILKQNQYEDWSKYPILKVDTKNFNFVNGHRLSMIMDSRDQFVEQRQIQLDGSTLKPAVATISDLPITGNTANDIRLVEDTQQFYKVGSDLVTWSFYSDNFNDHVLGNEDEKVNTSFSTLHMSFVKSEKRDFFWLVPESIQKGSSDEFDIGINDYGLKLLFYRGMFPKSDGQTYPLGSSDVFDYNGNKIADYRLTWNGEEGLYNQWWKEWLEMLNATEKFETYLNLPFSVLMNLDHTQIKRINNAKYLLDELEFTIDIKKGLTQQKQTLYRL